MADTTYNGWSTFETWNIALWIDNTQHMLTSWGWTAEKTLTAAENKIAKLATGSSEQVDEEFITAFAKKLQDRFERETPKFEDACIKRVQQGTAHTLSDLQRSELEHVNWREIAEHFLADVRERREYGTPYNGRNC